MSLSTPIKGSGPLPSFISRKTGDLQKEMNPQEHAALRAELQSLMRRGAADKDSGRRDAVLPRRRVREMEPFTFTKEQAIAIYWGIAAKPPEDTGGNLRAQIRACKAMYFTLGHEPAVQRLSEIANIDAARTRGRRRDQEAAARLLKLLVSLIKLDKDVAACTRQTGGA
jgi:hypothetical protein